MDSTAVHGLLNNKNEVRYKIGDSYYLLETWVEALKAWMKLGFIVMAILRFSTSCLFLSSILACT